MMYRSKFTGWRKITENQAKSWAKFMITAITAKTLNDAINIINDRLKGKVFTIQELRG